MTEKGSNHLLLRRNNYHLIKKYIYQHSPISRVEVAKELGLTTPTITGAVSRLISRGLLQGTNTAAPEEGKTAGRPRVMLEFVPTAYTICGVDVSPYWINLVLTDLQGTVLSRRHTEYKLDEYSRTLEVLHREISDFLAVSGIGTDHLLGIGICLPGLIDGSAGRVYTTFQRGWNDHDLSRELGQLLGVKVVVENNVRARMIHADLVCRSVTTDPFAYFFVSNGVACQMIIDGKVLYGQSAAAGEIGHTVVQRGGPVCPTCGNRGCLEALAGERAVLQRCRRLMTDGESEFLPTLCSDPDMLNMEQVLKAQQLGDQGVKLVMEDALDYLGIALANTINTVSPRTVMLDGHMLETQQNQSALLRSVQRNMFRVHVGWTKFVFLPYSPDRGAEGAAAVVVRDFLLNSEL